MPGGGDGPQAGRDGLVGPRAPSGIVTRGDRSLMNPGPGGYFALFSEIGFVLLVTTLAGALGGHWLDQRLGTLPVGVLIGFLAGAGVGTVGIYRLITRFLERFE